MRKLSLFFVVALISVAKVSAQSELYPKHFDLEQVTLLDGPMKLHQLGRQQFQP